MKDKLLRYWQILLYPIYIFIVIHFLKDVAQDILRISTPLDIFGDAREDLSFLPVSLQNVYLYGLGGISFLAEIVLLFAIPKVWKEDKLSRLGKTVIFLVLFLTIFFIIATLLDPRY